MQPRIKLPLQSLDQFVPMPLGQQCPNADGQSHPCLLENCTCLGGCKLSGAVVSSPLFTANLVFRLRRDNGTNIWQSLLQAAALDYPTIYFVRRMSNTIVLSRKLFARDLPFAAEFPSILGSCEIFLRGFCQLSWPTLSGASIGTG